MSAGGGSEWCACADGPAACQQPFCPYYQYVVELLGRRWLGAILRALMSGITRFSALSNTIPDGSDRMVSERLKDASADRISAHAQGPRAQASHGGHLGLGGRMGTTTV